MKVLSKFSSVEDLHESIQFIFTSCDFGAASVRGLKLLVYEALSYLEGVCLGAVLCYGA